MGLLDKFEKLINEHGSASILKEHLSLMKSQQAILERENEDLKKESASLKSKIDVLEKEIQNLKIDNGDLKKKITDLENSDEPFACGSTIR
ncbi:MAG: hypothetical protein A2X55_03270 [Nitrospirae bacterium GWB2_47_37]|nr:MAG: hypothetical protein A2X55_03270 [Nitrospirae bacterium GWB2_47_37]